ncbi:nitroreductase family protein [Allokutzneria multivorans]|uniref:nitroreductase family protein n=1 Tax=Allokutzneria multivorans TaxID=1142134 RepID=UPI0031E8B4F8
MDFDEVATTTRSVRRRLDLTRPVARGVVEECLRLALHAPNGANRQDWRFLVIDAPELRAGIAEHYRAAFAAYRATLSDEVARSGMTTSAQYLADRFQDVPVLVLGCARGRLTDSASAAKRSSFYGSVYPALWSFMMAARSRGLGTTLTTVHLAREREVAELLGIPFDEVTQVALIPLAHMANDGFHAGPRRALGEVMSWNNWQP